MTTETQDARIKRLAMRAARRGMKEMDLVLGPYATARLGSMDEAALTLFDALLWENDQDLWQWVLGSPAPEKYQALITDVAGFARGRLSAAKT